ncbi:hypothetical protein SAMN00808754_1644 [Thermanaeromonas toyohensis ToBE]|uniref:Uncharacterized protein n=1 Tax=Thermanaeromonas toyohensis ToBE TaxID=698762 RepID=A0A1W1VU17_9FIRM|nr:hypothetical protein [Thermanaeromonas toyohensis]SMB96773.1 hypothetical protein SAMN00808754_1644 [Thermanaeromonas toyohensis ToBE]
MHALHCFLVEVGAPIDVSALTAEEVDEVKWEVRQKALEVLDSYEGQVFDYYEEEGAGGWEDEFPGRGVVLGAEDPERFKELLLEFKDMPLKRALSLMDFVEYCDLKWRTREEIEGDIEVLQQEEPVDVVNASGQPIYWSGRRRATIGVTRKLIEEIWEKGGSVYDHLAKIFRLVTGEYLFESGFYSVPDYSAKIRASTLENALENPAKYALVFVDCHF